MKTTGENLRAVRFGCAYNDNHPCLANAILIFRRGTGCCTPGAEDSGEKKELVVMFDTKNIVKRYSMSESAVSRKTGIFN